MQALTSTEERLDYLVRSTGRAKDEIVAEAVAAGVTMLLRRQVADHYLAGDLSKDDARAILGDLDDAILDEADYARRAVEDDVRWGLQ